MTQGITTTLGKVSWQVDGLLEIKQAMGSSIAGLEQELHQASEEHQVALRLNDRLRCCGSGFVLGVRVRVRVRVHPL